MRLSLTVESEQTQAYLQAAERQVPFAASLALNRTAEEAIEVQRGGMRLRFTIRREWVVRQVRQFARATKDKPETIIEVTPRGSFLRVHETGGVRTRTMVGPVAIPTTALRPTRQANIRQALYPVQLGFFLRRAINASMATSLRPEYQALVGTGFEPGSANVRARHKARIGPFRTFELTAGMSGVDPRAAGIYQRTGPGKGDVRLIWAYRERVTIKPRLEFEATIGRVFRERWEENFRGMFEHAMRTAR